MCFPHVLVWVRSFTIIFNYIVKERTLKYTGISMEEMHQNPSGGTAIGQHPRGVKNMAAVRV